jgi:hypothetical protein
MAPPIPQRSGHTGMTERLRRMPRGDFFFIEGGNRKRISVSIQDARRRYGGRWVYRSMLHHGADGIGVWCLEAARRPNGNR